MLLLIVEFTNEFVWFTQEEEEENKSKSRSPTPMIDDLDDLHDIEIDDIDENLWVNIRMAKHSHTAKHKVICLYVLLFSSQSDEESYSETKIRLEDDEGYADDGQGKQTFDTCVFNVSWFSHFAESKSNCKIYK